MEWRRPREAQRLTSSATRSRYTVPQVVTRSKRTPRRSAVNHAAIDLGGKESQICIRRPDGTIVEECRVPTRKLAGLVATWTTSRIVMETCAEVGLPRFGGQLMGRLRRAERAGG